MLCIVQVFVEYFKNQFISTKKIIYILFIHFLKSIYIKLSYVVIYINVNVVNITSTQSTLVTGYHRIERTVIAGGAVVAGHTFAFERGVQTYTFHGVLARFPFAEVHLIGASFTLPAERASTLEVVHSIRAYAVVHARVKGAVVDV